MKSISIYTDNCYFFFKNKNETFKFNTFVSAHYQISHIYLSFQLNFTIPKNYSNFYYHFQMIITLSKYSNNYPII